MSAAADIALPVIRVVDATESIVALDLEGEFDIDVAPALREHAEQALGNGKDLIVNLSDATFIDSSIVQALFKADEAATNAGRAFVLQFGTHAAVERVLAITRVTERLAIASTRTQALELIQPRSGLS